MDIAFAIRIAREHLEIERDELRHWREDLGGDYDPNCYGAGHSDGAIAALNSLIEELLEHQKDTNPASSPNSAGISDSKSHVAPPAPTGGAHSRGGSGG